MFNFAMQPVEMNTKKDITIYDIAKVLNISPSTVSRGLKDHPAIRKDTKKKILSAARKMGYRHNTFASNLRQKQTKTIGAVVPRLDSYFMSSIIAGIEKVANQQRYNLIISQSQESVKKEISSISTLFNNRVDGLLVSLAHDVKNLNHFTILFKKKIPLIFFDRVIEHPNCISIVIDNYKAGYEATTHLIEQGCRKIAHITGNLHCSVYATRFNGYKKALEDNGIVFDQELVIIDKLNYKGGIDIAQNILSMKVLPDGIFTANDTSAVAIICELKQAGICIPNDIAVVGFNNDPVSKVIYPNLTTINYPGQEMGEVAASTLINLLNNKQPANLNAIVLRHNLIIRKSSMKKMII